MCIILLSFPCTNLYKINTGGQKDRNHDHWGELGGENEEGKKMTNDRVTSKIPVMQLTI